MPAINWNDVNKRILVIGKFSETPKEGFATGRKLTRGFIEEIQPGYFSLFASDAITFDYDDNAPDSPNLPPKFGGFIFQTPSEPKNANDKWKFEDIKAGDPLLSDELRSASNIGGIADPSTVVVPWAIREGEKQYKNLYAALTGLRNTLVSTGPMISETGDVCKNQSFYNRLTRFLQEQAFSGVTLTPQEKERLFKKHGGAIISCLFSPKTKLEELGIDNAALLERCTGLKKHLTPVGTGECVTPKSILNGVIPENDKLFWKQLNEYQTYYNEITGILTNPVSMPCMMLWFFSLYSPGAQIRSDAVLADMVKEKIKIKPEDLVLDISDHFQELESIFINLQKDLINELKKECEADGKTMPPEAELREMVKPLLAVYFSGLLKHLSPGLVLSREMFYIFSLSEIIKAGALIFSDAGDKHTLSSKKYDKINDQSFNELTQKWKVKQPLNQQELKQVFEYLGLDENVAELLDKTPEEQSLGIVASAIRADADPIIRDVASNFTENQTNATLVDFVLPHWLKDDSATDRYSPIFGHMLPTDVKGKMLTLQEKARVSSISQQAQGPRLATARELIRLEDDAKKLLNLGSGIQWAPIQSIPRSPLALPGNLSNDDGSLQRESSEAQSENKTEESHLTGVSSVNNEISQPEGSDTKAAKGNNELIPQAPTLESENNTTELSSDEKRIIDILEQPQIEGRSFAISLKHNGNELTPEQKEKVKIIEGQAMVRIANLNAYSMLARPETQEQAVSVLPNLHAKIMCPQKPGSNIIDEEGVKTFSIPLLLGEIIYSLPDSTSGFAQEHVAHSFLILMDMIRNYMDGGETMNPNWKDSIRFAKFYALSQQDQLSDLANYYYRRCMAAYGLVEYAKRIKNLDDLSKSGAEIYVIDNTIQNYVTASGNSPLFFERGSNIEAHIVYLTVDAGSFSAVDTHVQGQGALQRIQYRPLLFFENMAMVSTQFANESLTINQIPIDTVGCALRTEPTTNSLLMLATALLKYDKEVNPVTKMPYLSGGTCSYSKGYDENFFYFNGQRVVGFEPIPRDERAFNNASTYADIFKQLWYFDTHLATTFIKNRLWNIARRGELDGANGMFYFVINNWQSQKMAFDALPMLKTFIEAASDPNRKIISFCEQNGNYLYLCQDAANNPKNLADIYFVIHLADGNSIIL